MAKRGFLRINTLHWYTRLPVKWVLFLLTVLLVCFPYPAALLRHVQRWQDPNVLVEPDSPDIVRLVEELRTDLPADIAPQKALKTIESFVYRKVPYRWDWDTWGMADYIPTVAEVMHAGGEDCDGRAVVAASILRNLGYRAELVTDFAHVWVKTDEGETMSPRATKAIVATPDGPQLQAGALLALARSTTYGVAVFPLPRELIIVLAAWLLMLPGGRRRRSLLALALMIASLLVLRRAGVSDLSPSRWLQLLGFALTVGAIGLLFARDRPAREAVSDSGAAP